MYPSRWQQPPSRDHSRAFHERVTHTASSRVTPKRVNAHTHMVTKPGFSNECIP